MKKFFVKFISVLLTVVVLLSAVPLMGSALEAGLYLGETKITEANYWINDGNGGITTEGASPENYNLKYSPSTDTTSLTLTFNNLTVSNQITFWNNGRLGEELVFELVGENRIDVENAPLRNYSAIYTYGDVRFKGNGSLNIDVNSLKTYESGIDVYAIECENIIFEEDSIVNINVSTVCPETKLVGIESRYTTIKDNAQVDISAKGNTSTYCFITERMSLQNSAALKADAYSKPETSRVHYPSAIGIWVFYTLEMSDYSYIEAINPCNEYSIINSISIHARDIKMYGKSKIHAKASDAKYTIVGGFEDKVGSIAIDAERSLKLYDDAQVVAESGDVLHGYDSHSVAVDLGYYSEKEGINMPGYLEMSGNSRLSAKAGDGNTSIGINTSSIKTYDDSKISSSSGVASEASYGIKGKKLISTDNSEIIVNSGEVSSKDCENVFSSDGYREIFYSNTSAIDCEEISLSEKTNLKAFSSKATSVDEEDMVESYGIRTKKMTLNDDVVVEARSGQIDDKIQTEKLRDVSAGIGFVDAQSNMSNFIEVLGSASLVSSGAYYGIYGESGDILFGDNSNSYVYGNYYALNDFSVDASPKIELVSDTSVVNSNAENFGITVNNDFALDLYVSTNIDFKDAAKWNRSTHLSNYKSLKIDKNINVHSYSVTRKDATCYEDGYILYSCNHCGDSYKLIIVSPGHIIKKQDVTGNCTEKSKTVYSCYNCDFSYFVEGSESHQFTDWIVVEESTCAKPGVHKSYCDKCGCETTRTIWTPHTFDHDNPIITDAPTCTESGTYALKCLICGCIDENWYSEKLGHKYVINSTLQNCKLTIEQTCEQCGDTKTETRNAHKLDIDVVQPTCELDGNVTMRCLVCETNASANLPANGHNYSGEYIESKVDNTRYIKYSCVNCDNYYIEELVSTNCEHSYKLAKTVSATCYSNGQKTYTCQICEDSYTILTKKRIHNWSEPTIMDNKCFSEGLAVFYCNDCVETNLRYDTVPAMEHLYSEERFEPTDTEDGYIEYTCSVCGDTYRETLPATGNSCSHSYKSSVTTEATCTINGVETFTCSNCGHSYTEIITAPGHIAGDWLQTKAPTCTQTGMEEKRCDVCSELLDSRIVEATNHTLSHIKQESTCKTAGYEYDSCTVCGEIQNRVELPLGEHKTRLVRIDSTCTVPGVEYEVCLVCGVSSNKNFLPLADHTLSHTKVDSTCKEKGYEYDTCTVCSGQFNYVELPLTNHRTTKVKEDSTCTQKGYEYDVCNDCGERFNYVDLPLADHQVKHITEPSTCATNGKEYDLCTVCGAVANEKTLSLASHAWGAWVVTTEPTVDAEGVETRNCSVCGKTEAKSIPKLTVIKDTTTGVEIVYSDEYNTAVEIEVKEVFDGSSFQIIDANFDNVQSVVFDISTVKNGEKVQPDGKVKVRIPLPADFKGEGVVVCYVDTINGEIVDIPTKVVDGYVEFEADHFSYYAVVEKLGKVNSVSIDNISMNYKDIATITPSISADADVDYTVTYSSSNPSVASVDANGKVSTGKTGSATITVTVTDEYGNTVSDTCNVEVRYTWWQWIIVIVLFGWIWY